MKTKIDIPKGLNNEARVFFRKIAGHYELNNAGLELLKVACFTLQRWREAKETLDKAGLIVEGNIPRIHPAAKVEHDCRLSFCRMMKELGFNEEVPNE